MPGLSYVVTKYSVIEDGCPLGYDLAMAPSQSTSVTLQAKVAVENSRMKFIRTFNYLY